ncbi:hypothetical protein RHSIM_Rhsim11G0150600 [Rhododendron simsii]|uniref:Uncharacterized protein n=1 Tax=Rhododendron simsii TaxID=118357 RepID=A0A834G7R9_RHOSS|nr:hypothetical protein RHSIM_Rhsim11G0150600 [Rhododendron simsii]
MDTRCFSVSPPPKPPRPVLLQPVFSSLDSTLPHPLPDTPPSDSSSQQVPTSDQPLSPRTTTAPNGNPTSPNPPIPTTPLSSSPSTPSQSVTPNSSPPPKNFKSINTLVYGSSPHPLPHALTVDLKNPLTLEPTSYTQASKFPHWRHAMQEEYDALLRNQTCDKTAINDFIEAYV